MSDDRLGKYRLLRQLAAGGMGEVFFARQEGPAGFAKPAVVKRVLAHLAREGNFTEMFLNEARLAALLQHANVVQIFELGEDRDRYFIAMEYVHGRNLRTVRRKLRENNLEFPPAQLARIMSQALSGLHYAHTMRGESGEPLNIIHRDMSPDNIMVGFDGAVKVLDFGIAKASSAVSHITKAGMVKGKFAYMSPEHLRAEPIDARSDIWAVGVLMYEMLAGERPFNAPGESALVKQVLTLEPRPLHEAAPHVPPELSSIVHLALEKDRDKRFSTADVMASALERYAQAAGVRLTNSDTKAFMRELYGAEADENPGLFTPTMEGPGETQVSGVISDVRSGELQRPSRPWLFNLAAAAAILLLGAGVVSVVTAKDPAPVAVIQPTKPEPLALPSPAAAAVESKPEPKVDAPRADTPKPDAARPPMVLHDVKGHVDLRVLPWAEVFEGKRALGVTPMAPLELTAGAHTLTLRNSDLSVSREVVVKVPKNATATVRVDLRGGPP